MDVYRDVLNVLVFHVSLNMMRVISKLLLLLLFTAVSGDDMRTIDRQSLASLKSPSRGPFIQVSHTYFN